MGLIVRCVTSHVKVPSSQWLRQFSANITGNISANVNSIQVGQHAECIRVFTVEQVQHFGELIGDLNPIHLQNSTQRIMVHGMLSSSIFSSIFGSLIHGSMYRSQSLTFHSPIYCMEMVIGRIIVTSISKRKKFGVIINCDTFIEKYSELNDHRKDILCISGKAEVLLPLKCL